MQLSEVISKLNWFYTLELNQVQVYSQQSKQVNDIYIQKILGRVAEIEQGHVDNISDLHTAWFQNKVQELEE